MGERSELSENAPPSREAAREPPLSPLLSRAACAPTFLDIPQMESLLAERKAPLARGGPSAAHRRLFFHVTLTPNRYIFHVIVIDCLSPCIPCIPCIPMYILYTLYTYVYPVYPVYPSIPCIPMYTLYTLYTYVYPVYPVYPMYTLYTLYTYVYPVDVLCYQGEASMNGIMQEKTDQIPECCSTWKVQCCLLAKYINVSMVMIYPQAISTTPQRIISACHLFSHTDLV